MPMSLIFCALLSVNQTATITGVSALNDSTINQLLLDENVVVFAGEKVVSGAFKGYTQDFVVVEPKHKAIWIKARDVDSIQVRLPLHERIRYNKKERFLVSVAGAAFLELTGLAIGASMSDELRDKLQLPVAIVSPVLGFALAQTQVASPERHPSETKTKLFLMILETPPQQPVKAAPEE